MKKLNNYILEKLKLTKDSKIKKDIDYSSALDTFFGACELSKYGTKVFNNQVKEFIDNALDKYCHGYKKIYMWKADNDLSTLIQQYRNYYNIELHKLKDEQYTNEYTGIIIMYNNEGYCEIFVAPNDDNYYYWLIAK